MARNGGQRADQGDAEGRGRASYESLVNRSLGRAKKRIDANDGKADDVSEFFMSSARTLALLDLAAALRESRK